MINHRLLIFRNFTLLNINYSVEQNEMCVNKIDTLPVKYIHQN
jgi:hypothetical protein